MMKKRRRIRFKINNDTMTTIVVLSLSFCVCVVVVGIILACVLRGHFIHRIVRTVAVRYGIRHLWSDETVR